MFFSRRFLCSIFILLINFCVIMPCFAGNGVFSQNIKSVDEVMPYPPYPSYPSGIMDKDKTIYRYAPKSSDFPNLIIVDPLYDDEGNVISPGYYSLILSEERDFLILAQSEKPIAKIPVFRLEEDKRAVEKLRDKKYQKKLAKEAKKQAKLDLKRAKSGVPSEEKSVYMNATIEYKKDGAYYLIKYERDRIRAWGAIKG